MKKICFALILILISSNLSLSQKGWTEQVSGVSVTLTSAHAIFDDAWVCGYSGTVLRSTNNGSNWLNVSGNGIPSNVQLINIVSLSTSTALVAGYIGANTFVYRTSNNGANWTQVFTEANGFINAINIKFGTNIGFMMGDPVGGRWSLWKTNNGGVSWDSTGCYLPRSGTTEAGWNNSLYGFNDMLWFGTNNSKIYYSTNYGSSWVSLPTPEVNSYALWFENFSPQKGLFAGSDMFKTTNFGSNWSGVSPEGTGNFGGISGGPFIITDNSQSPPYNFYVRSDNKIYWSVDQGTTWNVQYTAPAGNYRYIGTDFYATSMWAVRDNGGISNLTLVSGINQTGTEVPDKFSLSQNYPNPFNPVTKIKFAITRDARREMQDVRLSVYDGIGREVKTLVNEKLSPGSYEADFDGSNFSSGIYFYRLTSGEFTQTKQMILLK